MKVFDYEDYMKAFEDYMRRVFGKEFGREIGIFSSARSTPTLNAYKEKGKLVYEFDFPGFKKDEISVSVGDGVLVVHAEKKQSKEQKDKQYFYTERVVNTLHREITLPEGVSEKDIEATFKDGILRVIVPLHSKRKVKHIRVK